MNSNGKFLRVASILMIIAGCLILVHGTVDAVILQQGGEIGTGTGTGSIAAPLHTPEYAWAIITITMISGVAVIMGGLAVKAGKPVLGGLVGIVFGLLSFFIDGGWILGMALALLSGFLSIVKAPR